MLALTQNRFLRYQRTFYDYVMLSPMEIDLITTSTVLPVDKLHDFVGASERVPEATKFKALYKYDITGANRGKAGVSEVFSGELYLSPLQLEPVYGKFPYDKRIVKVGLAGQIYIVDWIDYKEQLYGSCIAVVFHLKDNLRG